MMICSKEDPVWRYNWIGRKCFSVQVGTFIHSTEEARVLPDVIYLGTNSSNHKIYCRLGGYLIMTDHFMREDNHYWPGFYTETSCYTCPYYGDTRSPGGSRVEV